MYGVVDVGIGSRALGSHLALKEFGIHGLVGLGLGPSALGVPDAFALLLPWWLSSVGLGPLAHWTFLALEIALSNELCVFLDG